MKRLHRDDLFGWSVFDESRNIDFHGLAWVRGDGNVIVDPVPMSAHDEAHLGELGGAATIVVTNSDHTRDAAALAEKFGAKILGPRGERDGFPIRCDGWLGQDDTVVPGLVVVCAVGHELRPEVADRLRLAGVGIGGEGDGGMTTKKPAGVGHRLPEVAGGCHGNTLF